MVFCSLLSCSHCNHYCVFRICFQLHGIPPQSRCLASLCLHIAHANSESFANSLSNSVYTHLTGWLPFGTPRFGTGSSCLVANCTTSCVWWTSLSSVTTRRAGTTAWSWRWWLGCVVPGGGPLLHSKGMPWLKTILFLLTDHDKICGTERADEQIVTKKNMTGRSTQSPMPLWIC